MDEVRGQHDEGDQARPDHPPVHRLPPRRLAFGDNVDHARRHPLAVEMADDLVNLLVDDHLAQRHPHPRERPRPRVDRANAPECRPP